MSLWTQPSCLSSSRCIDCVLRHGACHCAKYSHSMQCCISQCSMLLCKESPCRSSTQHTARCMRERSAAGFGLTTSTPAASAAPTPGPFGQPASPFGLPASSGSQSASAFGQATPSLFGQATPSSGQSTPAFGAAPLSFGQPAAAASQAAPSLGQSAAAQLTAGQTAPPSGQSAPQLGSFGGFGLSSAAGSAGSAASKAQLPCVSQPSGAVHSCCT